MAEGDGFENRCAGDRTGGSNPSSSDRTFDTGGSGDRPAAPAWDVARTGPEERLIA